MRDTAFGAAEPLCNSSDRDAWLVARRSGVGASEVATIMGLSSRSNALELYSEKVNELPPDDESKEFMSWGLIFEQPILAEYGRRTRRQIEPSGMLLRNADVPHWLCTLDAIQHADNRDGPGSAECKTVGSWVIKAWAEEIPIEVEIQVQWQMLVPDFEWGTVVWLPMEERRLQWRDVEPHDDFVAQMIEEVDAFWQRVQRREPPDADGTSASKRALARLYPDDTGEAVRILGPRAVDLSNEYEANRAMLKKVTGRQEEIKNMLRATLRQETYGFLDDGRYWSSKSVKGAEFHCPHCDKITGERRPYRSLLLGDPPKKKRLPEPYGDRQLANPLIEQLKASTKGES